LEEAVRHFNRTSFPRAERNPSLVIKVEIGVAAEDGESMPDLITDPPEAVLGGYASPKADDVARIHSDPNLKFTYHLQRGPEFQSARRIHLEQPHGRPVRWRPASNQVSLDDEMFFPAIPAPMKEEHDFPRIGVHGAEDSSP
jgi:hypothetical protein